MPGTHSQGTGIGAGERWTKANYGHSCYVAHPKERQSVHNDAVYFEVEILHRLNVQACPELVKAEEKQGISTWTNFTDDCLSCQQKRLPNLEEWKWRRVREGSLPEKTESHHHSCEKWIMSFLSNLCRFSGKLVIEGTIEMTVLFGDLAFSRGSSVHQLGGQMEN